MAEVAGHTFDPKALAMCTLTFGHDQRSIHVSSPYNASQQATCTIHRGSIDTVEFNVPRWTEVAGRVSVNDNPGDVLQRSRARLETLVPGLFARGATYRVRLSGQDDVHMVLESVRRRATIRLTWINE